MKILYVGNFATGRGECWQICPNAEYIAYALKKNGYNIDCIHEREIDADLLLEKINRNVYDFVLTEEGRIRNDFIPYGNDYKINGSFEIVLNKCRQLKIPVVAWLTNIFFGLMGREHQLKVNPIFKADIVFSTDGGHQKEFKELGINHFILRQGIHEPEAHFGTPQADVNAEIGFIGSVYKGFWNYRKQLLNFLNATYGNRFKHFGQDGRIRHEKLNNLIASLKIVIGDSFKSDYYWSNRLYEMLGRGAFLIFPNIKGIEKEFTPYEHFIPYEFGDFKGIKEIIDYYLDKPEERKKIATAGLEHCRKYHTYEIRVKEMLKVLKEQKII